MKNKTKTDAEVNPKAKGYDWAKETFLDPRYLTSEARKVAGRTPLRTNCAKIITDEVFGWGHIDLWEKGDKMKPNYGIRNLKKCKMGKKTTVELTDGRKGEGKVQGGDQYDPYIAFALAYTAAQFESKTAFRNFVDKMAKKNQRYGIYVKGKKLKPIGEKK